MNRWEVIIQHQKRDGLSQKFKLMVTNNRALTLSRLTGLAGAKSQVGSYFVPTKH